MGQLLEGPLDDLAGAADIYEASLRELPDASVAQDLAELSYDLHRVDRARELFLAILERGEAGARIHSLERLAALEVQSGRPAEALPHLKALADLEPTEARLTQLAEAARGLGRSELEESALVRRVDGGQLPPAVGAEILARLASTRLPRAKRPRRRLSCGGRPSFSPIRRAFVELLEESSRRAVGIRRRCVPHPSWYRWIPVRRAGRRLTAWRPASTPAPAVG